MSAADRAALLVQHEVAPVARERYEAWVAAVTRASQRFEGFQGVTLLRPQSESEGYTVIVQFDRHEQLQSWLGSAERHRLIVQLQPLLQRAERLQAGMGLWFTPALAGGRQAKPCKQFLLTFSAIYPLSLVVPAALRALTEGWGLPAALVQLLATGLIVWLMVYLVMPRCVRAVAGWLLR